MMKRFSIILFTVLAFALSFTSCKEETKEQDLNRDLFLNQMDMGIYHQADMLMTYARPVHQLATNDAGTLMRIQNDNLSKYIDCRFSEKPAMGAVVNVEMKAKGFELPVASGAFEVIAEDGVNMWLWDSADQLGIIIRMQ